jgi:cytochrome c peroxidase
VATSSARTALRRNSETPDDGACVIAGSASSRACATPVGRRSGRWLAWLCVLLCLLKGSTAALAATPPPSAPQSAAQPQPITPIPQPPAADPRKLALGESLFHDHRLSHDGSLACDSCHDLTTNGAASNRRTTARNGSKLPFTVLTVFNAALSFRLNWEGNYRTLEAQAQSSLENPANMATSVDEVLGKLRADPKTVQLFWEAYRQPPDRANMLDALATYERSLLTPGSRFDRWLQGDETALTSEEQSGYQLFQSLGCTSCHQGVNIGGNLFQRHGIFHPLAAPDPVILRVPSLRNVATLAPYFQDGSSPNLQDAVRKMAEAQLDQSLTSDEVAAIVAFLKTLTGTFHGTPVKAPAP